MFFRSSAAASCALFLNLVRNAYAASQPDLSKRIACNADTCLDALRATSQSTVATPFCQTYISLTTDKVVIATVTPTTHVDSVVVVSETVSYTQTTTQTEKVKVTVTSTSTSTVTQTSTVPYQSYYSQGFLSSCPVSRISSACSCLGVPNPTTGVTSTADFKTIFDPVTSTTKVLKEVIETVTASVTVTENASPVVVTETATATVPAEAQFRLKAASGPKANMYIAPYLKDGDDRNMVFSSNKNRAALFTLTKEGHLRYADVINHNPAVDSISFQNTGFQAQAVGFTSNASFANCKNCVFNIFSIGAGNTLVAENSAGPLAGMNVFKSCLSAGEIRWTVAQADSKPADCNPLTLAIDFS